MDNPPGVNNGSIHIGWNLDAAGKVTEGWSAWIPIVPWQSWEDQGSGLALASFGAARPMAVVFHIDNAAELNAGLLSVTPLALDIDQQAQLGLWRLMPYPSEVLPVHAALLHTNKVLFFAGSGNNAVRARSDEIRTEAAGIHTSVVWDYQANTFDHPNTLRRADGRPIDYFCCGHCFLKDGRLLVAGGTGKYDTEPPLNKFLGINDAMIFDPATEQWHGISSMAGGRWYPTVLMLSDGRAVAFSGQHGQTGAPNRTLEMIADPDASGWTIARPDFGLPFYPHLFVVRDGRLFFTGGKMDSEGESDAFLFDPLTLTDAQETPRLRDTLKRNQSASVLLPPAQDQKVMILGGGPEDEDDARVGNEATALVDIIDLSQPMPAYQPAASLNYDRMHVNAVLLPDRTVLAVGGAGVREAGLRPFDVQQRISGRLIPERFDPSLTAGDKWTPLAAAQVIRLYHSVALLLPDGRVLSASGNPNKGTQVEWLPADPQEEMRLELFSPPYLFAGPRPVISIAPTTIAYGGVFNIATPQANQIKWVSLIRPGLTTHSFNVEQRLVDVPFNVTAAGLRATVTDRPTIAPPGWYMLFLANNQNVPSVGQFVHLQ